MTSVQWLRIINCRIRSVDFQASVIAINIQDQAYTALVNLRIIIRIWSTYLISIDLLRLEEEKLIDFIGVILSLSVKIAQKFWIFNECWQMGGVQPEMGDLTQLQILLGNRTWSSNKAIGMFVMSLSWIIYSLSRILHLENGFGYCTSENQIMHAIGRT